MGLIQKMLSNSVAARWYQMGVVMGVPPSDLEIIRESPEYHGAGEREAAMLKAWLERGILPRTWQVLSGRLANTVVVAKIELVLKGLANP